MSSLITLPYFSIRGLSLNLELTHSAGRLCGELQVCLPASPVSGLRTGATMLRLSSRFTDRPSFSLSLLSIFQNPVSPEIGGLIVQVFKVCCFGTLSSVLGIQIRWVRSCTESGPMEGFSWLCSPEEGQFSDNPQAKQEQTEPEVPFLHLLSRCSRKGQTPGEQTGTHLQLAAGCLS